MSENTIWKGNPSQWSNFISFLVCGILAPFTLGLSLIVAAYRYLIVRTWQFEITNERIIESKGILSKNTDECELYRIKDIKLSQPFWLRLVGLSNLILSSSDRSHPTISVPAIGNGNELREQIRTAVEQRRDKKGVKEVDYE
ncbi:MAG: hypothetical protein CMG55_07170 [Candidatus Marinimicrobia bacterium]|nr:hypothetical protein [Candidatus Neomarinimicrobiota bacterium]|tara:strand:+ start:209 stop:634 length:426 start_codon:yes stop_codon:yes gene_type:complete